MSRSAVFEDYIDALACELRKVQLDPRSMALVLAGPRIAQESYNKAHRKMRGIFFTGARLADRLIEPAKGYDIGKRAVIDPAMGAGDLFIALARTVSPGRNHTDTITRWSRSFAGVEPNEQFVFAARLRLCLLSRILCGDRSPMRLDSVQSTFSEFRTGDFLKCSAETLDVPRALILMNPPFTKVRSARLGSRGSGFISAAAIFLQRLCEESRPDTEIIGLFPEVLRCGTSYESTRTILAKCVETFHEESLGRFDRSVDIDVFRGHYKRSAKWDFVPKVTQPATRLAATFEIRVGSVVPHRAPGRGPWRPFASASTVTPWDLAAEPTKAIRYGGKIYEPPFVVLRRTSSPKQRSRAIASVVVGQKAVAVENHLIVLVPNDGLVTTCRRLVRALKRGDADEYLNETMRCRHLTWESVASIPIRV